MGERPMEGFADRLAALVEERRSQIVLGLDPDPSALWPGAVEAGAVGWAGAAGGEAGGAAGAGEAGEAGGAAGAGAAGEAAGAPGPAPDAAGAAGAGAPRGGDAAADPPDLTDADVAAFTDAALAAAADVAALTAAAVERHCRAVIDAAGSSCVAVKPQVACFERLGAPGWAALAGVVAAARDAGLLVIADAKRGDVPVTARAYAQALVGETPGPYGPVPGLGADAFTANPLLGRDALAPLLDAASAAGAGCFVLVRTSNPGAAEVQDGPPGDPLHERLARMVDELGEPVRGASGLSSVGAVTGATRPDLLARLRELMPAAIFLLPGVGAQGGSVADLGSAFAPHPAGGLIASSRSIVGAAAERGGDPAAAAAAAAEELRAAAWAGATG